MWRGSEGIKSSQIKAFSKIAVKNKVFSMPKPKNVLILMFNVTQ